MRPLFPFCISLLLASCASPPPSPAPLPAPPAAASQWTAPVLHYIRSNRDGSEPEHIVHFRPSRTDVAVYKYMSKCTNAAYVTAQMSDVYWEAIGLDAGKVGKTGGQEKFGRIALVDDPNRGTRIIDAWVDLPPGRMTDSAEVPGGIPWFLFDYDLGDLNTYLQQTRPEKEFLFAFALIWPESKDFFSHMGTLRAQHRGIERRGGRNLRRFDLDFLYGREGTGTLWTDPVTWHIVEAELGEPNHPGMKDFRLKLERVDTGGQAAWDALLKGHYADCPAGN